MNVLRMVSPPAGIPGEGDSIAISGPRASFVDVVQVRIDVRPISPDARRLWVSFSTLASTDYILVPD